MRTTRPHAIVALLFVALPACSRGPSPSHVATAYHGNLRDDTLVEASTTVLVTKRNVVIALDCSTLQAAPNAEDAPRIDQAVAAGLAARLPAGVTIYTPPFSSGNPRNAPLVVTDDKYAGRLCTPDAYDVVKE